ncbi:MAG: ABC transporter permease subunit [Desulfosudaceae bacterium]
MDVSLKDGFAPQISRAGQKSFSVMLVVFSLPLVLLVVLPLLKMVSAPSLADLLLTIQDKEVVAALARSLGCALSSAFIALLFGTPLAYLLARKNFTGKRLVEGIVDLPIMIPHPVIGIALLSVSGRNHPLGRLLADIGVQLMGTWTGIITVMLFVGLPFYVNTVKAAFEAVPPRLENVSRTLGAPMFSTFFRVTLPLVWRSVVLGMIMATARAISEFGAIVIVAYHPMTAPVLIYERFTAHGLQYSQPVAVWLILISLALFVLMRFFAGKGNEHA